MCSILLSRLSGLRIHGCVIGDQNGRLVLDNAEYQAHLLELHKGGTPPAGVTEAKKLVAVVIDRSHGRAREK